MRFTQYKVVSRVRDGRRWAARLRFTGDESTEAVLRFGTSEPTDSEIDNTASAWMAAANDAELRRGNKLNREDVEGWLWQHWRNVRREIIRYCIANPTCTGAEMVARLNEAFAASPFDWPKLFALMQKALDIPSFVTMRDYIVAHASSMDDAE